MLCISSKAAGQISPGELSRAHQSFSGLGNCTRCHELSTGTRTFRCLTCHKEIADRISAHRGLHATYDITPGTSNKCLDCHPEHNGRASVLIKWDITHFDHDTTGYKLEGHHAGLSCRRCHSPDHMSAAEAMTIRVADRSKTLLGLSPACISCHRDEHNRRLGNNCLQCHWFTDWKQIDIKGFDHSLARYPLTGLHLRVACAQCHGSGPARQVRYLGIPFRDCGVCHRDPHQGAFSQSCRSCHDTAAWRSPSSADINQTFDHSRSRFPLLGKHRQVECVQCHRGANFREPLAFQKCTDCHRPDPHGGQFANRAGGIECSNCHTADTFKPSTFGRNEHAATAYPLEGKHATLRCTQCHIPKGRATVYAIRFRNCTDCHVDQHAGQFTGFPYLNRCQDCHNLERFRPSTFRLHKHNETAFPLSGGHIATPCVDCHKVPSSFKQQATARYHWPDLSCRTCHNDPHAGRFDAVLRTAAASRGTTGCEICHSTTAWNDLSCFDHSKTSFPLGGAHRLAKCADCHKSQDPKARLVQVDFTLASARCGACHADVHAQQFSQNGKTECGLCHDTARWKPSRFDHERQASFRLEGAHRRAPCESCHKLARIVDRRPVLFYKPTPKECVTCHGHNVSKLSRATN